MLLPESIWMLSKGSWIEPHDVEVITGRKASHKLYARSAVAVAKEIERRRRRIGQPCTVRIVGDRLRVLEDAEASAWNRNQSDIHGRGQRRAHRRMTEVDVTNLSEKQRAQHDRDTIVSAARMAGQAAARQIVREQMRPKPTQRTTPGTSTYGLPVSTDVRLPKEPIDRQ